MDNQQTFVVGGMAFSDAQMATVAQTELKRIELLNSKINYEDMKSLKILFDKAYDNHVFQTPIGLSYMLSLRNHLINSGEMGLEDKPIIVPPFTLVTPGKEEAPKAPETPEITPDFEQIWKARIDVQKKEKQEALLKLRNSIILNVILAVLIIVLFIISQTGNNPTILNYRTKIINQYSEWEQDLNEREQIIKEKESRIIDE